MTPDYARGFNAGIDKAMQILHERCATTFDPMLKAAKMDVPKCKHPVFTLGGPCADCGEMVELKA